MKRLWIGVLPAALPARALWAHPGTLPHVHSEELVSLVALFLALIGIAVVHRARRRR